jgi:hypothetical protein
LKICLYSIFCDSLTNFHKVFFQKLFWWSLSRHTSRQNWIFFFILKVANIRCFILIAVEIFHNIIRKLAWNEGNTSLFDSLASSKAFNVYPHNIHIFMNMIIWPLMTYTVISFGKAFAHVQNFCWKKAHVINKNIDEFYAKTTQRRIQQALCQN